MMMAVFAAMCVTSFTACGGDDDDDIPGKEVSGSVTYYEPCFDWGSTNDHVKAYMTGWELVDGSNDYALLYSNGKNTTTVTYAFLGSRHGLSMVTVTYITSNAGKAERICPPRASDVDPHGQNKNDPLRQNKIDP